MVKNTIVHGPLIAMESPLEIHILMKFRPKTPFKLGLSLRKTKRC